MGVDEVDEGGENSEAGDTEDEGMVDGEEEEEESWENDEENMDFSAEVPELDGQNLNGGYTPSLPPSLQEKAAAQSDGNLAFDSILK